MNGIDTNTLLALIFGLIGAGYALFMKWAARVDRKLDNLEGMRLEVTREFLTKKEYEQGKAHVWSRLEDHDRRIADLEHVAAIRREMEGK